MAKKIVKTVGGLATGVVGGLIGSALKGKKKPDAPEVPAPVMPLPDDEAIRAAKKRSIISQRGRAGRSSTILTDNDTLGG